MPDSSSLHCLIYHSQASRAVHEVTLPPLLRKARLYNQQARLSGLLFFAKSEFLQILEGPEPALSELYARIVADPRHFAVRTLVYGPIAQRSFPNWGLAYASVSPTILQQVIGLLPTAEASNHPALPPPGLGQVLRAVSERWMQDA